MTLVMLYILAIPKWLAWIPLVLLALIVPFSFWVRWQVRKIKREDERIGSQRLGRSSENDWQNGATQEGRLPPAP